MSSKRSDPYLKRLFNRFNRKYWKGALPAHTIVRWATPRQILEACDDGSRRSPIGFCYFDGDQPYILLHIAQKRLKWWSVAKQTLHHEMSHLAGNNRDNHGPVFDGRMLELAMRGAFHRVW